MQTQAKKRNLNPLNLAIDSAVFVAFLVAMEPHFSGIPVHEWLSIAFGAAIIVHLLLHWTWLVEVTRRFFRRTAWSARVNYALNALLFIAITVVMFTGLMISQAALPLFGVQLPRSMLWRGLHTQSANLSVILIGLHVALHWGWIVNTFKRHVIGRVWRDRRAQQPTLAAQPAVEGQ